MMNTFKYFFLSSLYLTTTLVAASPEVAVNPIAKKPHAPSENTLPNNNQISAPGTIGIPDNKSRAAPITGLAIQNKVDSLSEAQINSFASFLAGEERYEEWKNERKTRDWIQYKKNLITQWRHFYVSNFQHFLKWSSTEVYPQLPSTYNVFYPFSGPDALHVLTLYPHATNYIMVGQESIGSLENLYRDCQNPRTLGPRLTRLNLGINSLIVRSFFVTADMAHQVTRSDVGVVPFIVIQLRLLGYSVTRIEYVTPQYAKIDFNKLGKQSTIHYLSTDLTNTGLAKIAVPEITKLHQLLDMNRPFMGFVKSASYLMHNPPFETVRNRLLNDATTVVQDDSGIPYRHFSQWKSSSNTHWVAYPYGQYTKPFGTFGGIKAYIQVDLQKAFAQAKPMPFRLGYGYSRAPSNVVIYRKQTIHHQTALTSTSGQINVQQELKSY